MSKLMYVHRLDLDTGRLTRTFGVNAAIQYKQDEHVFDNSALFTPEEGDPVKFALRHKIASHFRRDNTWGALHAGSTLHEKLPGGRKTLIIQDKNIFSYKLARDFTGVSLPGHVWPVREWISAVKGNFIPVYTGNVATTVLESHKAHANRTKEQFAQECFVYYGGVVRPFSSFFHDWDPSSPKFPEQQKRLMDFYRSFSTGEHGLRVRREESDPPTSKETRVVDTPALFRVVGTKSMKVEEGAFGVKVNWMRDVESRTSLFTLIRPREKSQMETQAYQDFAKGIAEGRQYWVEGTTTLDFSTENSKQVIPRGQSRLEALRVVVNDFEKQVLEVGVLDIA